MSFLPQTARDRKRRQVGSATRNERRLLRRADDHYRAEMAAWAARGGYDTGSPPEFHGTHGSTAIVRTADGAEIIFLLHATSAAAGADSEPATDDDSAAAEHTWRIRSGKASGPPPPDLQKRQRRPGFHTRAAHLAQGPISRSTPPKQYSGSVGRATPYARRWERAS